MNLILQNPYSTACQQACIAMLIDKSLEYVITLLGKERLDFFTRRDFLKSHRVIIENKGYVVSGFGENGLSYLVNKYPLTWISYTNLNNGECHACLIYEKHLYDPFRGIDPILPWYWYISQLNPIERD